MKIIILQILISIVLCATLVVIAYYIGAKRGIPRLEKYKKNLKEYKYDNSAIIKSIEGVLMND